MDFTYLLKFLNHSLEELVGLNCTKLGLDIEPRSSILVQLAGSLSTPKLSRASLVNMPASVLTDEFIQNPRALSEVISQLIEDAKIKKKSNVAIAAPGSLVITKKIASKEGFTPTELNTYAWNEARKAFPGMMDNLYLDYVPLPDNKLLLVAARKKELQDRLGAILTAGLTVEAIDVDYYALARAYSLVKKQITEEDRKGYVALINIDSSAMILNIMQNEELVFFHRQSYNGLNLLGSDDTAQALSDTAKEALEAQIKRLLQFFQTEFPGRKLSQALLSGRIARVPGMRELLEKAIDTPTQLANPLSGLNGPYFLKQQMEAQAPMLMLSCGLAMRGLRA